jgi:hypothetical protein
MSGGIQATLRPYMECITALQSDNMRLREKADALDYLVEHYDPECSVCGFDQAITRALADGDMADLLAAIRAASSAPPAPDAPPGTTCRCGGSEVSSVQNGELEGGIR